jgi:hypothetical protein
MNTFPAKGALPVGKRKKSKGHFCKACGDFRPNEKFSGKSRRQHICKDCKKKGRKAPPVSRSVYDKKLNYFTRGMKNCLILYTERSNFFLFEFLGRRYITRDDFESEIFLYQNNTEQHFFIDESFRMSKPLLEVLCNKYYDTLESGQSVEHEAILISGVGAVSKKRQKHAEVIRALNNVE